MDTLLLFLPNLIIVFCQFPGWKSVRNVALGFAPFICWEMFSLCYYGFLFPNTAYAKLDTGVSSVQLLLQGIGYLVSSFTFDPLIFVVMGASVVLLLQQRAWKDCLSCWEWGSTCSIQLRLVGISWLGVS